MEDKKFYGSRLPPSLIEWLKETAKANDRSANSELIRILREAKEREKAK